ncbi:MAG: hypothetical protein ABF285_02395 [Pacificibacter sp.]
MSIIQKIILNRARVISFFAWFLVATSVVLAFWGLGDQSLWLDEIFTFYFSGQDLGDPNAILERSMEDIHPPFYYHIIHYWSTLWSTLGIQFATSARLFSAIMAVLSLAILSRVLSKRVSHSARAVTLALAATSGIWVYFAQEARSYALAHVIVLIIAALAIRQGGKLSTPQPVPALVGNLFLLAVVSAVGSLVHMYLLLVAGGFFAGLLWLARDVRSKILIAAFGVTVALASFVVLVWTQSSSVLSSSENWIKTDLSFLVIHFKSLLRSWMLPTSHGIVILLIVVLQWRMLRNIRPKHSDASILFFRRLLHWGFPLPPPSCLRFLYYRSLP